METRHFEMRIADCGIKTDNCALTSAIRNGQQWTRRDIFIASISVHLLIIARQLRLSAANARRHLSGGSLSAADSSRGKISPAPRAVSGSGDCPNGPSVWRDLEVHAEPRAWRYHEPQSPFRHPAWTAQIRQANHLAAWRLVD